ncbi:hypothetical protein [Gemmiger sp.]
MGRHPQTVTHRMAALVTDGTLKISDSTITTDAATADSWSDYAVDKA